MFETVDGTLTIRYPVNMGVTGLVAKDASGAVLEMGVKQQEKKEDQNVKIMNVWFTIKPSKMITFTATFKNYSTGATVTSIVTAVPK